jgi:hypothetical protein
MERMEKAMTKGPISLSVALSWRKTLMERHGELVGLRNQNANRRTEYYGANVDKERVIDPLYDVIELDRLITNVAREIRFLDEAVKETNQITEVKGYVRDDSVLGELTKKATA